MQTSSNLYSTSLYPVVHGTVEDIFRKSRINACSVPCLSVFKVLNWFSSLLQRQSVRWRVICLLFVLNHYELKVLNIFARFQPIAIISEAQIVPPWLTFPPVSL